MSCGGGGGADASTDIAETCIASTNCVVAIFRTSLVAELSRGYNTKRVHFGSETSFYVQPARLTREESARVAELVAAVQLPSEDADAPRLDDDLVPAPPPQQRRDGEHAPPREGPLT